MYSSLNNLIIKHYYSYKNKLQFKLPYLFDIINYRFSILNYTLFSHKTKSWVVGLRVDLVTWVQMRSSIACKFSWTRLSFPIVMGVCGLKWE